MTSAFPKPSIGGLSFMCAELDIKRPVPHIYHSPSGLLIRTSKKLSNDTGNFRHFHTDKGMSNCPFSPQKHLPLWLVGMFLLLPASWQGFREIRGKGPQPWELKDSYRTIEYRQGSAITIQRLHFLTSTKTTAVAEENSSASSSKGKNISATFLKKKTNRRSPVVEEEPDVNTLPKHAIDAYDNLPPLRTSFISNFYLRYTDQRIEANQILKEYHNHADFRLISEFSAAFFILPDMMADLIQGVFQYLLTNKSISHFEYLIWFDLLAKTTLAGVPESLNLEAEAALQQGLISLLGKLQTDKSFLSNPVLEYESRNLRKRVGISAEALLSVTKTRWLNTFGNLDSAIGHIPFALEVIFPHLGLSNRLRNLHRFLNLIDFDEKLKAIVETLQKPGLPNGWDVQLISSISNMANIFTSNSVQTKTASLVLLYYIKHRLIGNLNWSLHKLAANELSNFYHVEANNVLLTHDYTLLREHLHSKSPTKCGISTKTMSRLSDGGSKVN